jgi:uncharacterized membrane protein
MSDLIIIGYPDETTAGNVWAELVKLQHDYLVDLEDAAIIRRDQRGKLHVTTPSTTRPPGAASAACSGARAAPTTSTRWPWLTAAASIAAATASVAYTWAGAAQTAAVFRAASLGEVLDCLG